MIFTQIFIDISMVFSMIYLHEIDLFVSFFLCNETVKFIKNLQFSKNVLYEFYLGNVLDVLKNCMNFP